MRASSLWLAALLGALVGSLPSILIVLLSHSAAEPPPAGLVASDNLDGANAVSPDSKDDRLSALDRRVSSLEHQRATVPDEAEPSPGAGAPDARLAKRVEQLERLVDELRAELAGLGPMPTTPEQILKALADRNLHGRNVTATQRQRRMELRRRLLELAPEDPSSAGHLRELFNETLVQNTDQALALLDRFAGRTGMPAYQAAMMRSNGLQRSGRHDAARQLYSQARSVLAKNDQQRVSAGFSYAYSYQIEGRYQEAIAEFQALIAAWSSPEPPVAVRSSIEGAKIQIEKMRGWLRTKK